MRRMTREWWKEETERVVLCFVWTTQSGHTVEDFLLQTSWKKHTHNSNLLSVTVGPTCPFHGRETKQRVTFLI